jgi:hypothetical protein
MKTPVLAAAFVLALVPSLAGAAPQEIKGKAILDHPCGKTSMEHMRLINAGKFDDAFALGTPAMIKEWKAMPADQKKMMTEIMQKMSSPEAEYKAKIEKGGVLTIDGAKATLNITEEVKDENGTSTSVQSQQFEINGKSCLITM